MFELLPSSLSHLFSPQNKFRLTRQRDKNATIFITIGLVVGATIGRQINLGNSQRRRRKRRGTFDDDEREEYNEQLRQRWRQMGESEEEEKESNERAEYVYDQHDDCGRR